MNITKDQFKAMSANKKLEVLFDNTEETKKAVQGYKFYQKLTAIIGSVLVVGMGILFEMHLVKAMT
jgi:hypothetical protein